MNRCKVPSLECRSLQTLARQNGTGTRTDKTLAWVHMSTLDQIEENKNKINICLAKT
jgi:hypothetical protein